MMENADANENMIKTELYTNMNTVKVERRVIPHARRHKWIWIEKKDEAVKTCENCGCKKVQVGTLRPRYILKNGNMWYKGMLMPPCER
jgi:hypothetical protein